ncbi:hypothetical protein AB1Y20_017550 [Prymnesium parvum]|uniref:Centrosomal protein of 162 kDa n=1 Tax=Prymnesium parvum TaxID=97485 RepID=A0AB34JNS0_PRYPA
MKNNAWVIQLRQLLFEQRIVGIWLGHERLSIALALKRWHSFAVVTHLSLAQRAEELGAEHNERLEQLERERALLLHRTEEGSRLVQQLEGRLHTADESIASLRAEHALALHRGQQDAQRVQDLQSWLGRQLQEAADRSSEFEAERKRWTERVEHERAVAAHKAEQDARRAEELQLKLDASEALVKSLQQKERELNSEAEAEQGRWSELLERERMESLQRSEQDGIQLQSLQSKLSSAEGTIAGLRAQLSAQQVRLEEHQEHEGTLALRRLEEGSLFVQQLEDKLHAAASAVSFLQHEAASNAEAVQAERKMWAAQLQHERTLAAQKGEEAAQLAMELVLQLSALKSPEQNLRDRVSSTDANAVVQQSTMGAETATLEVASCLNHKVAATSGNVGGLSEVAKDDTRGNHDPLSEVEAPATPPSKMDLLSIEQSRTISSAARGELEWQRWTQLEQAIQRGEHDAARLEQLQDELSTMKGVVDELREENIRLRQEVAESASHMEREWKQWRDQVESERSLMGPPSELDSHLAQQLEAKLSEAEGLISNLQQQLAALSDNDGEAEGQRWAQLLERERALTLQRGEQHGVRVAQLQLKLRTTQGVLAELREENFHLRQEAAESTSRMGRERQEWRDQVERSEPDAQLVQQLEAKLSDAERLISDLQQQLVALSDTDSAEADGERWAHLLERERALTIQRGEQDAVRMEQLQVKLRTTQSVANELREQDIRLRQEIAETTLRMEMERQEWRDQLEDSVRRARQLEEKLSNAEGQLESLHREKAHRLNQAKASASDEVTVERRKWTEQLERERALALQRDERDAQLLEQLHGKLNIAEDLNLSSRTEILILRQELARVELSLTLVTEEKQREQGERTSAWLHRSQHDTMLRAKLDAEKRRLEETSAQLRALEQAVEEAEEFTLLQQANELRRAQHIRHSALAAYRGTRSPGEAWAFARAHFQLLAVRKRHEAQLEELQAERLELDKLRDARGQLEWRVTESRAKLLILVVPEEDSSHALTSHQAVAFKDDGNV